MDYHGFGYGSQQQNSPRKAKAGKRAAKPARAREASKPILLPPVICAVGAHS